jgi:uncharacterized protein YktA (UPF0223 family)
MTKDMMIFCNTTTLLVSAVNREESRENYQDLYKQFKDLSKKHNENKNIIKEFDSSLTEAQEIKGMIRKKQELYLLPLELWVK